MSQNVGLRSDVWEQVCVQVTDREMSCAGNALRAVGGQLRRGTSWGKSAGNVSKATEKNNNV